MLSKSESLSQRVSEMVLRELRNRNYSVLQVNVGGKENDWDIEKIWVTKAGRDLCDINCVTGTISYRNSYDRDEINKILELIKNFREQEEIFEKAQHIKLEGLERYKLLAEYNNTVLAACEISTLDHLNHKITQFEFVTWEKDKGTEGVHAGNYFGENYAAAKEDFAKCSGLINKDNLFSETEMLTIYSGLVRFQDLNEISGDQEKIINDIKDKISNVVPDIEEQIYQDNPKFEESEENLIIDNSVDIGNQHGEETDEDSGLEI